MTIQGVNHNKLNKIANDYERLTNIGFYHTNFIAGFWESSEMLDTIFGIDKNYNRSVQGWLEIVHPEDAAMMNEYLTNEVIGKRKKFNKKYRIVRINDQQTRWVHGIGEVSFDNKGNITDMVGTIQDITEKKLAEDSLNKNYSEAIANEKLKQIAEKLANFGTWQTDILRGITVWSDEAFRIYGYEPGEIEPSFENFLKHLHPEDFTPTKKILDHAAMQLDSQHLEFRIIDKKGIIKHISCGLVIERNEKKEPILISGFNQDITGIKFVEEQLRRSEERFRLVSESPLVAISWASPEGRIIQMNETLMNMLGYSEEELRNRHFSEFSHPEDNLKDQPYIEKMNRGELDYYRAEKRYITKNKKIVWAELNLSNVKNETGEIIFRIAIVQNISERKKAEESLRKSEANLKNIFENTDTAYVLLDTDANVLSFNSIANELSYETTGKLLHEGMNYLEFMPIERSVEVARAIKTLLASGKQSNYVTKYDQAQSSIKWLSIGMYPVFDEKEKIIGLSIGATDITEQKNIEELVILSNERFELATKATNDVIWDRDIINNKIVRSENYKKIFGYNPSADDVSLEQWIENIHPDDKKRVVDNLAKIMTNPNEHIWEENYRLYKSNGEIAHLYDRGYIVRDENNKAIRVVGAMHDVSDKKIAEEKINQLSQAVEQSPVSIVITDTAGNIQYVNKKFTEVNGYSFDEVIGKNPRILKSEHTSLEEYKEMWETITSGESWRGEFQNKKKNGECYWESVLMSPIKNEHGVITNFLAVKSDITLRKKMEEALHKSEGNLKRGELVAKFGYWEMNRDDKKVITSEGARKIYGTEEKIFTIKNLQGFILPEDRSKLSETMRGMFQKNKPYEFEFKIKRQNDGEMINIHSKSEYNPVTRTVFGVIQDITDRKKAEKKHFESLHILEGIINSINVRVFWKDKNLNYLGCNKIFAIDAGFNDPAELIGKNDFDMGWHDQAEIYRSDDFMVIETGRAKLNIEEPQSTPDGKLITLLTNKIPLTDANGNVCGVLGTYLDISERKNAELLREKITNDLVQRNKDLEQFTYIVSHNLRAPVANIIGFNSILSETEITPEVKNEMLDGINVSVNKLDEVIKDLNNILQVKYNITEKKEKIFLSQLFEDVKDSLEKEISDASVEVISDFSAVNEMNTLKSYMISIFHNVISNGIKYRRPDVKPLIEIKSIKLEKGIQICFKDNGLGIDMNKQGDKLFGLYKRFHTQHAEGKGVGLYMVKTQVEALGGKIDVQSEPGKGTEFIITFEN